MRILLDVDTGVDDALALAFAVRDPRIELVAVTTVAGNVGVELTTRNTLRVLDWLGASDVPVARGAERPLAGVSRDAAYWHGDDGLGGAQLPESRRDALPDGVGYLIDRVLRQPGELTLVCTGPLTNLALAAQRQPAIVGAVKDVVVMGGAVQVPGNVTPVAEFNIHADPEAAAIVFGLPWQATLVGLDVTSRVRLTSSDRAALEHLRAPEATLVRLVTQHAFDTNRLVGDLAARSAGRRGRGPARPRDEDRTPGARRDAWRAHARADRRGPPAARSGAVLHARVSGRRRAAG